MAGDDREEWYEDIDALVPIRAGRIKVEGTVYDAGHFADLSNDDSDHFIRLDLQIAAAATLDELKKLQVEQIRLLCPIPEDVLLGLTMHKRERIRGRLLQLANVPAQGPPAPGGGAGSSASEPSSGDSSAGNPPSLAG
jgi:hypothetical protein